jgi:hypothetical protein
VPLVWAFSPLMGRFFDHSFLSMFNFKESWWVLILLELSSPWCQLFLWKTPSSPCTNCTPFFQTLSFHLLLTINPSTFLSYIGFLFAQTLAIAPHLSSSGLFGMVYEHLSKCFIPKDPSSWFSKLFQTVIIIICQDILKLVALMLRASKLLGMAKDINGLRHIIVGKMFLWLINHSIVLRLWGSFQ